MGLQPLGSNATLQCQLNCLISLTGKVPGEINSAFLKETVASLMTPVTLGKSMNCLTGPLGMYEKRFE